MPPRYARRYGFRRAFPIREGCCLLPTGCCLLPAGCCLAGTAAMALGGIGLLLLVLSHL
ncbi:MAG: hypothetical protein ABSF27_03470 [Candidatus Dormibacteria bacterium]